MVEADPKRPCSSPETSLAAGGGATHSLPSSSESAPEEQLGEGVPLSSRLDLRGGKEIESETGCQPPLEVEAAVAAGRGQVLTDFADGLQAAWHRLCRR